MAVKSVMGRLLAAATSGNIEEIRERESGGGAHDIGGWRRIRVSQTRAKKRCEGRAADFVMEATTVVGMVRG
ncbi:unnamed protein product [Microthlaspi erraticum]|uniref:Uncharacterized protein n=1 Tax=Microthlaspi erraticum TaxID=1685480 RepID=A0A6D2KC78_9BRAS|nr:unnamed protein product [Microthlaspi erraticum]